MRMENSLKLKMVPPVFCNLVFVKLIDDMQNTNEQSLKQVLKDMVETCRLKARLNQTKIQKLWVKFSKMARKSWEIKYNPLDVISYWQKIIL